MNVYNKGKYLLRHAFEGTDYLPHDILFREKANFFLMLLVIQW